jgi:transposase-like protein
MSRIFTIDANRGYTVRDLAEKFGVKQLRTIRDWLKEMRVPLHRTPGSQGEICSGRAILAAIERDETWLDDAK